jgi:hypothetical protein
MVNITGHWLGGKRRWRRRHPFPKRPLNSDFIQQMKQGTDV